MRETLSKRPRVIAKATAKTAKSEAAGAKAKLRSTPKPKPSSVSKPSVRPAAKTKSVATKPSKTSKKLAVAKKPVIKPAKPASKPTKTNKPASKTVNKLKSNKAVATEIVAKRKNSKVDSKPAKVNASNVKDAKRKARVKIPAPEVKAVTSVPTASAPVQPAIPVQPVKTITKPRRRPIPPIPATLPPVPEAPRRSVTTGALRAFEHAVRVFNRRHFEEAKSLFDALLSKFPTEVELSARSQMYIQVCSQKMAHVDTSPHNADELYDHGVYALNIGDFSQAKTFFEKALRLKPNEAHLLYSLAATHAQTGSMDQALDYLKRTIQVQPRYRFQALNDSDFSDLRENKQFLELIGLASPFDLLQSRR